MDDQLARATPIRCVGGILHDADGALLLIERAHPPEAGQWSLPGGRVAAGESDHAALQRELHEETGLTVVVGTLVGTVHRGEYEIHDYSCRTTHGRLRPGDDAADAQWFDSTALHELERRTELSYGLFTTLQAWHVLPD